MLLVALTPAYTPSSPTSPDTSAGSSVATKMTGIVLASIASGAGELSFLGLTHYFGSASLAAWSSGTGAAGLVGAGAYALATTVLGISVRDTLLMSSLLPVAMLLAFFLLLPRGPLMRARAQGAEYLRGLSGGSLGRDGHGGQEEEDDEAGAHVREDEGLLTPPRKQGFGARESGWFDTFILNLRRAQSLFFPL